jgi:hypothetical protein
MGSAWGRGWWIGLVLIAWLPVPATSQSPALSLSVGQPESGWRARVQIGDVLNDPSLRNALDSALPLRFHLRVELWRNGFLDRLEGADEVSVALVQDPLSGEYSLETGATTIVVDSLAKAQVALRELLTTDLRPTQTGRHYYLATLEVETLSLSDLDELRRWLRGEVAPAIGGRTPPTRAVEQGLRRLMVRVMGLPTRRFEARTGTFRSN